MSEKTGFERLLDFGESFMDSIEGKAEVSNKGHVPDKMNSRIGRGEEMVEVAEAAEAIRYCTEKSKSILKSIREPYNDDDAQYIYNMLISVYKKGFETALELTSKK